MFEGKFDPYRTAGKKEEACSSPHILVNDKLLCVITFLIFYDLSLKSRYQI
jgi:hypothetical protein